MPPMENMILMASFLREKVVPIAGDIGRPYANFTDEVFAEFEAAGGLAMAEPVREEVQR